jgi:methylated-DNA-[protein]-cysteine S-methyltransferase
MPSVLPLSCERLSTPIGHLLVVTDDPGALRAVEWEDHEPRLRRLLDRHYGRGRYALSAAGVAPSAAVRALAAYFAGEARALDGLPVVTGGTPFQRTVWAALRRIPAGRTVTYGELAGQVGQPAAVRAVGAANGANPVSIVVPCHRVVGADGSLTGYAGGLERKRWLLAHEKGDSPLFRGAGAGSR